MEKFAVYCIGFVMFVIIAAGLCLLFAWPFMLLWNYGVVAAISGTKPVSYWSGFCFMMFISLFLKSIKLKTK